MMKKKYSRLIEAIRTPAKASDYIAHIDDLEPGLVVPYGRVSRRQQQRKGKLNHQIADLTSELERRGHDVTDGFKETASGWADDRTTLQLAILEAERVGAVVMAESADRFIRHPEFNPKTNPDILPTVYEFERLMIEAANVQLATLHHPDTHWKIVRSLQTKRGQRGSGHRGGRPAERFPKKARRLVKKPKAIALRKQGFSYRRIGRDLGVAWSTIRNWTETIHRK